MRVYEWGPEDGSKVLCVHGITTTCMSIGGVAYGLVEKGCRVMLFVSYALHTARFQLFSLAIFTLFLSVKTSET